MNRKLAGIYIHIPFCKTKCNYCNFYSVVSRNRKPELLEAIRQEIRIRGNYTGNNSIQTIYLGGGTPSLMTAEEIDKLLDLLNENFCLASDIEITLEANPDDLSPSYLNDLHKTAVNRLSIGIQSFNEKDLSYLSRIHTAEQSLSSVREALNLGFSNVSIDLIYGIPTLTPESWNKNIETFLSFGIPHLSAYALTVEPKTALDKHIRKGRSAPVDDDLTADHFAMLMQTLEHEDFLHYEISNFSKKGFLSKHNSNYWKNGKYVGFGPSAHSYDGNSRQWNIANIQKYIQGISDGQPVFDREILTQDQKYNEYIMVSLRTMWGTNTKRIKEIFGNDYLQYFMAKIKKYIDNEKVCRRNSNFVLTSKGKFLADAISVDLFI